jgi:hypothetical protein
MILSPWELNGTAPEHAPSSDPRVLVISPIGCGPLHSGNRTRLSTLLQQFRQMGLDAHFAWAQVPDQTTWARISSEAREETASRWISRFMTFSGNLHVEAGKGTAEAFTAWMDGSILIG